MAHPWPHRKPIVIVVLMGLLLLSLTVWLSFKARNAWREYDFIGVPVERNTITIMGEGKVSVMPDIANVQVGTVIERPTVSAAQQENTRIMNALNDRLAAFGVAKADMQTASYSIQPVYDYTKGKQTLRGYQVSQSLRLKIRELDKIGDILGAAGELGANQVGGIDFTVDQPEAIKQRARMLALENAKTKAAALAEVVGVELRRVVSFGENVTEPYYNAPYAEKAMAFGIGGAAPAPTIQPGSAEYVLDVNVTYEIE